VLLIQANATAIDAHIQSLLTVILKAAAFWWKMAEIAERNFGNTNRLPQKEKH